MRHLLYWVRREFIYHLNGVTLMMCDTTMYMNSEVGVMVCVNSKLKLVYFAVHARMKCTLSASCFRRQSH
jgi:hypothetical protein